MDDDPQASIRQLESLEKTSKESYVLRGGSGPVAIGSSHSENGFVLGGAPSTSDAHNDYRGDAVALCSDATRLVLADNGGRGIKGTPKIGIYGRLSGDGRGFILTNLSNKHERIVHDADGGVHIIKPGSDVRINSAGFTYDFNGKGAAEVKRKPWSKEVTVNFNTKNKSRDNQPEPYVEGRSQVLESGMANVKSETKLRKEEAKLPEKRTENEPVFRKATILDGEGMSKIPYADIPQNEIGTPIIVGSNPEIVPFAKEGHVGILDRNGIPVEGVPNRIVRLQIKSVGGKRVLSVANLSETNLVHLDDKPGIKQKIGVGVLANGAEFALQNNKRTYFDNGQVLFTVEARDLNSIPPQVLLKVERSEK